MPTKRDSKGRFLPAKKIRASSKIPTVKLSNRKTKQSYIPPVPGQELNQIRPHTTLVAYLLDKSGSMSSFTNATIEGVNGYIEGLKEKLEGEGSMLFSMTQFDSNGGVSLEKPYIVANINHVVHLNRGTYKPRGRTPLYDAIGETIRDTDKVIANRNLKIDRILFVIHTDGQENSSREFNKQTIKNLVSEKETSGYWTFVYMGATPESWAAASSIGMHHGNYVQYDTQYMKNTIMAASGATRNYRMAPETATVSFASAGMKMVGGQPVEAQKRYEHLSSDGYTKYTATHWKDNTWSCNCPGWAYRKSCKHISGGPSAIQPTQSAKN